MSRAAQLAAALRRLKQHERGRTTQPGMFSTLDEIIAEAPFETNSIDQWRNYLKPGRMLKREGTQFPLKKEELDWSLNRLTIDPNQKFTKEQLRELVSNQRQRFGVTMGRESYDDSVKLVGIGSEDPMPKDWMLGETEFEIDVDIMPRPKYGDDYGSERLHHKSPGSVYEESVTRMKGLDERSHYDRDGLSWSRTSSHGITESGVPFKNHYETPMTKRVRLIEEIQSDLHSRGAKKILTDPVTGKFYRDERYAKGDVDEEGFARLVTERTGYADPDSKMLAKGMRDEVKDLTERGHKSWNDPDSPSSEYEKIQDDIERLQSIATRLEGRPQNAPYKNPGDYAGLELKKQLLNAVDNDEDYLAITRGLDQIERYDAAMDSQRSIGMKEMYDKVYPSELKKLAKRYGATMEDVEISVTTGKDVRPQAMVDMDAENLDDLFEMSYDFLESGGEWEEVSMGIDDYRRTISHVENEMEANIGMIAEGDEGALKDLRFQLGGIENRLKRHYAAATADDQVALEAYQNAMADFENIHKKFKPIYEGYEWFWGGDVSTVKDFPAMKLTEEVKERVRKLGVPQYQHGGLVRSDPMPGYEVIPRVEHLESATQEELERLRYINYELSGGETAEEMNKEREAERLYNDPKYWKDVPKHVLASMSSLWKTLDSETGEAVWNFGASPPPFEMVERGIMTLEEWNEMKETADRVREEKPAKPGIIDETISMRVLMTEIANIFREDREEPPEYATEAMERTERLQKAVEEGMDLDPAVGFPQRFAQMMGFMLGQVPSPKSATEAFGAALVKAMPKMTAKIPKAVKVGIGAPMEFMDPTIRPAVSTYLTGAAAGTGILYGIEAAAESKLEALEEELEDPEKFAGGGKVASALMKLRTVGERMLKERVAERKGGMEDWSRDYRDELKKLTGIEDPFTPADPSGPIIGHPNLEDYPPGYFPDDEVAAEMRRLYKAVENLGPHTGGQYAGKQLIDAFPEDADLGELLNLSRRVRDVEEVEWNRSVEVGRAERKAEELAKWGDPGSDPHAYREAQSIELTNRVITDNEEHIIGDMRRMADEANRNPRIFQQLTEEDMFFDPIINAPKGGGDYDDFFGSFGNFGPETDMISDLWIKALGDEFKYKKISRRLKQIQEEGL